MQPNQRQARCKHSSYDGKKSVLTIFGDSRCKKARDGITKTQIRSWSRSSSVAALGGLVFLLFVFSVAASGPYQVRAEPPLPNPLLSFGFFIPMFIASLSLSSDVGATNWD